MTILYPNLASPRYFATRALSNITPFTMRDAYTFEELLEGIHKYIRDTLIPHVNEIGGNLDEAVEEFKDDLNVTLNDFRNEMGALAGSVDDKIDKAIDQIVNSAIELQDPVLAAILQNNSSLSKPIVEKIVSTHQATINVKDYGAKGDGVTNDTQSISDAISAMVGGETLLFPPGKYMLNNSINNHGKSMNVKAYGASFIKNGDFPHVFFYGTFEDTLFVTSIVETGVTDGDQVLDGVSINMSDTVNWRKGDVVKIISNDIIPESRDAGLNVTSNGRLGQFFTVYSVNGQTAKLIGKPVDNFTTGIRVAKINEVNVNWEGGTFDVTESHINAGYTSRCFDLNNLMNPLVANIVINRTTSMGLSYSGCYNAYADNVTVKSSINSLSNGGLGYAICNLSTQGLHITGLYAQTLRSGFTDGHGFIPENNPSFQLYGRPLNTRISNSVAEGCNTGFGTHSSGVNTVISNSIVKNCGIGIGFRGRDNSANNITIVDSRLAAIRIFTEIASRTYNNTINNVTIINCVNAIEVFNNGNSSSPVEGVREARSNVISNVYAKGVTKYLLIAKNSTLWLNDVFCEFDHKTSASGNLIENSVINGRDWNFNSGTSTVSGLSLIQLTNAAKPSFVKIDGITFTGDVINTFTKLLHGTNEHIAQLDNVVMDARPTILFDSVGANSWIKWRVYDNHKSNSAVMTLNTSQIVDDVAISKVSSIKDPIIYIKVALSSPQTMGKMPAPNFIGQIMVIRNASGHNLTIKSGAIYGTNMSGATDAVVPAYSTIMLVAEFDNWTQIKIV